ncbi:MAG: hypothetical protein IT229_00855, partial [Flavobacteriales bacterium]|nr:hypothetical protein [Flavobacteriales bacterium]
MKRLFLLSFASSLTMGAFAQLAPQTPAPLAAHLHEVNAQWTVQDPEPAGGDRVVSFENDAQRIAEHLHRVRTTLASRTPEGLSAEQLKARTDLLDDLDRYADRELFPQNQLLPYRNPVFIDPQHTACAVGQLMIESGHASLAERISKEMNLGYVHELVQEPVLGPAIGTWATEHGFTADELAWIQPAYNPAFTWNALGGGTNARVTTLLKLSDNDLLVAGDFTDAGGVTCTSVARWNGTNYTNLGTGIQGEPVCAAELNGQIYLGGTFQNFAHDLAIWNGTTWSYSNVQNGMAPHVFELFVWNGTLYAGSEASGFSGTTDQVYKFDNGNWVPVGQALNGPIHALEMHNGELVAGGLFTGSWSFGTVDNSIQHVARFNDTAWVQLEDGLDAGVYDLLETNDGYLYAGGDLYANIIPTFGLARLAGGVLWEQLMPNHTMYIQQGSGVTQITSLAAQDTTIWFGGDFGIVQLMTTGWNCGRFLGTPDMVEPTALFDGRVNALAAWSTGIVSGGDFAAEGMLALPHIAFTDLATGITPLDGPPSLSLWPSPAVDLVNVDTGAQP